MQGALSGFFTIGVIVATGALLAHFRVLGDLHRALLNRLAFLVASPSLLFSLGVQADLAASSTIHSGTELAIMVGQLNLGI